MALSGMDITPRNRYCTPASKNAFERGVHLVKDMHRHLYAKVVTFIIMIRIQIRRSRDAQLFLQTAPSLSPQDIHP